MKKLVLFLCFMVGIQGFMWPKLVQESHTFYQEELLNGMIFAHTLIFQYGKREEKFLIDKVPVLKDDYYHQLDMAYLAEQRLLRQNNEKQRLEQMNFNRHIRIEVLQKLITKNIAHIQELLDKIEKEYLKPYFAFSKNSIHSMQDFVDMKAFVRDVQHELPLLIQEGDVVYWEKVLSDLEVLPVKIEQFFKDSVQNAIKRCDDTELLKQLLVLVS